MKPSRWALSAVVVFVLLGLGNPAPAQEFDAYVFSKQPGYDESTFRPTQDHSHSHGFFVGLKTLGRGAALDIEP